MNIGRARGCNKTKLRRVHWSTTSKVQEELVDPETRKEYHIDVANRFTALEGLEISSVDDTWVTIRDSIKVWNGVHPAS